MKKEILLIILLILIIGCNQGKLKTLIGDETLEVKILAPDGFTLDRIEVDLWKSSTKKALQMLV